MSDKHSKASIARWAKIPDEDRKKRMAELAKKKAGAMGSDARRAHALMMVQKKREKAEKAKKTL